MKNSWKKTPHRLLYLDVSFQRSKWSRRVSTKSWSVDGYIIIGILLSCNTMEIAPWLDGIALAVTYRVLILSDRLCFSYQRLTASELMRVSTVYVSSILQSWSSLLFSLIWYSTWLHASNCCDRWPLPSFPNLLGWCHKPPNPVTSCIKTFLYWHFW